jgi:hypothetical protein
MRGSERNPEAFAASAGMRAKKVRRNQVRKMGSEKPCHSSEWLAFTTATAGPHPAVFGTRVRNDISRRISEKNEKQKKREETTMKWSVIHFAAALLALLLPTAVLGQVLKGSLGLVGVIQSQTLRLSVVGGPGSCLATLSFTDGTGAPVGPSENISVSAGQIAFLDLPGRSVAPAFENETHLRDSELGTLETHFDVSAAALGNCHSCLEKMAIAATTQSPTAQSTGFFIAHEFTRRLLYQAQLCASSGQ